ncbi:hypothetical protein RhiLY_11615 [Ceratobasidium sp. AG-Ba]|nr:hypothetical protein RhiLY_11615 [Ceratobasidium sp. AG-Ba]
MHARSHSETSIASTSSSSACQPRIAVVGRGREALACHLIPPLAVCSSPELTIPTTYPAPNPNPGPVLRRIASEAPYKPARASRLPPLAPSAPKAKILAAAAGSKGLPPPPRPRRRPPPVFVTTLGAPLALAEQTFSPFVAPDSDVKSPLPRRSASVPPSAVSSSFWGCGGDLESEEDLDLDGLDAVYDEFEFSDSEGGEKSALGGTYFPPSVEGGRYVPSPPASPRALGVRRPLRVQVSVERVAFRDDTRRVAHQSDDDAVCRNAGLGLEDGIKTREYTQEEAVHAIGGQRATKVSIGKALGRWLKRHT